MGEVESSAWQIFLVVGLLLAAIEMFTPTFFTLPAGLAFFFTAGIATVVGDWVTLLVILAVNLTIVYFVFYRFVWPRLGRTAPKMNADGMSGKVATVSEAIDPASDSGEVKVYGDRFRVIATQPFEVGERVIITGTSGNKLLVRPLEDGEG